MIKYKSDNTVIHKKNFVGCKEGYNMNAEKKSREEIIEKYKYEVENLSRYIPWLQKQTADMVARMYKGEGTNQNFSFPVYDSTLLSFINDVGMTSLMDKNYQYVYSRYHIRTHEDEWRIIDSVDIMNIEVLGGIMSKYILGGMTRAKLWKDGIEYEIYLRVLVKAKEIIEFWDKPLAAGGEYLLDKAEN